MARKTASPSRTETGAKVVVTSPRRPRWILTGNCTMPLHECPSVELLDRYALGEISEAEAQTVDTHLEACTVCIGRLDDLARQPDRLVAALRASHSVLAPTNAALGEAVAAVLSGTTPPPAPPGPELGALVNGYRIVEELGRGGMGRVYRALHPRIHREVALKLLRPGLDSAHVIARFEAEREALARMDHPHIARVLDGGATEEGQPFFVMELVRGIRITRYCDEHRLDVRRRLELFIDVCQAVQHAHQKGIIHRDLKPSNVLVAQYDGKPAAKVIDFGVAKALERPGGGATEMGMLIGTLEYMSPEQADLNARDVDTRSDLYALGVLLYELLTGDTPLAGSRARTLPVLEVLHLIREEEPQRPSVRLAQNDRAERPFGLTSSALRAPRWTELDWIVLKALDKDRSRRYETAAAFAEDVGRFLRDEPVQAGPPSRAYRVKKFVRRNRTVVAFAGVLAVLLFTATAVSAGLALWANRERIRAGRAEDAATLSAEQERESRMLSDARLGQIEKANGILTSVFRDLDPREAKVDDRALRLQLGAQLDKAAAQIDAEAIADPVTLAALHESLGVTQNNLGFHDKAIVLLTQAAQARDNHLGSDHDLTLTARNNLATALHAAGRDREAIEIVEDVLRRRTLLLGEDHTDTCASRSNLATLYRIAGRARESVALHEKNFRLRVEKFGPAHRQSITSRNNLASAYRATGKRDRALQMFRETLELCLETLGPNHPDTLTCRNNIAATYVQLNRAAEAIPELEALLAIRSTTLGPEHPHTLLSRENLGEVYLAAKRLPEAAAMLEETVKLRSRVLGPAHRETLNSKRLLGQTYVESKRTAEGIALHEETLRQHEMTLGADHPDALESRSALAVAYRVSGRLPESIKLQEEALAMRREKLGPDHPKTQLSAGNLATAYMSAKRYADAEHILREQIESRRKTLPADHPTLSNSIGRLGLVLLAQKKFAEAEPCYREAVAAREKAEPDSWGLFDYRARLGEVLLAQNKLEEAEPLLVQGYEGMVKRMSSSPEARTRVPYAFGEIIKLYETWGKKDVAEQWRAKQKTAAKAGGKS